MANRTGAVGGGWIRWLIIDRYLLRQFVQTFLICGISLTGLYVVIDGSNNLDEFILFTKTQGGSLLTVMGAYYAYHSLLFFDGMSPIVTLIATMFTMTWIQRHQEMTALEAAGVPKARIIRPLLAAVLAIIGISVANRELVIPRVRDKLSHNAQDMVATSGKALTPRYDNETGVLLGGPGSKMFASERRIARPDFHMPAGLDRYDSRLVAANAVYLSPGEGRPGGYLFQEVQRPTGLDKQPSLSLDGQPVLLTPLEHPWLKPGECFVASQLTFEHLEGGSGWQKLSSTPDLIAGLRNRSLDFGADERLTIHTRFVQPALDFTLVFLGLPLVLSRSNRNMFVASGLCMALVCAFMLVVMACNKLGSNYWFEPALAAWLPLIIFVPCAVGLYQPVRE